MARPASNSDPRPAWAARWFLPDLSAMGAAVTLVYLVAVYDAPRQLFRDADSGWHIRIGERILDQGSVPSADPFSFSKPGHRWFAWEWAMDVAMGALHRSGGLAAVAWFYSVLIMAATWVWFRLSWIAGGDFLLAAATIPIALTSANAHWLARPHIAGWLLLMIWLCWCEAWRIRPFPGFRAGAVRLIPVLLLGMVWANVHGSFALAIPIALCFAVESRMALLACPVFAAGTLMNPYGLDLHRHTFSYLTNRELLARIAEWQSVNFHADGAGALIVLLLLAIGSATLALAQGRISHALVLAMLAVLGLRSARALPILAMAGLPFANAAIRGFLESWDVPGAAAGRLRRAVLDYSANLRRWDAQLPGMGWVCTLLLVSFAIFQSPALAGFPPQEFPVSLTESAGKLPAGARLLAPDKFGGYLIYRFDGRVRVFFDGRSDFYGLEFLRQYIDLVEVRPGWQARLDEWRFTHALLPIQGSLQAALVREGWRILEKDEQAILLERK